MGDRIENVSGEIERPRPAHSWPAFPSSTARNGLRLMARNTSSSRDNASFPLVFHRSDVALPIKLGIVTEYPLLLECDPAIAIEIGANARTLRDRLAQSPLSAEPLSEFAASFPEKHRPGIRRSGTATS